MTRAFHLCALLSFVWNGCAHCQSPQIDSISQKVSPNQTANPGRANEAPKASLLDPTDAARQQQLQNELAVLETRYLEDTPEFDAEFTAWEERLRQEVPWQVLDASNLEIASGGAVWEKQPDGSLLVRSGMTSKSDYVVKAATTLRAITALRIEALPDDSLPGRGPGHSANGNAVLNELVVTAGPSKPVVTKAQFVRVEAPGKGRYLHLAEVEVKSGGLNVALQGRATQVSTDYGGEASRAIDGNRDGNFAANSTSHTAATDDPWWEVDLGQEFPLDEIILSNRTDIGTASRLPPFRVSALSSSRQTIWNQESTETPGSGYLIKVSDHRRPILLRNATATFSQPGWEVPLALDGDLQTGWAFSPQTGERQTAVFEISEPVDFGEDNPIALEFILKQQYGEDHTLGRFRLSVTAAAPPVLALSPAVNGILAKQRAERSGAERLLLRELFRPYSTVLTQLAVAIEQKKKALTALP